MQMAKLGKNIDFYRGQYRARVTVPERLRPFIVKADGTPRTTLQKRLGTDPKQAKKRSYAILASFYDILDEAKSRRENATTESDAVLPTYVDGPSTDQQSTVVPEKKPSEAPVRSISEAKTTTDLSLEELLERFHLERSNVAPGTKKEHAIAVRMLASFIGEGRPVQSITRQDMLDYKKALIRTPANCQQRFPGLTIPQAIKANEARNKPYPALHPNTINKKWLSHTNTILSWAKKNLLIDDNPCDGVKVDTGNGFQEPSRVAFSPEDIRAMFSNSFFANPSQYRSKHWALLIALYTGARSSSEIRRIKLTDIYKEQGIYVFDLIEATKNAHSKRLVPIHQDLMRLGLLGYVEKLRRQKKERLFWDWEPEDKINRWFLRSYKAKVGISDKRKVFHSFRHSMKTELARCGVNRDVSDLITGHKDQSVGGIYISDQATTMVESMKDGIDRVNFGLLRIINTNLLAKEE
nr:site-specific integrase [uncultured Cohaesibacter sp.]